jgi:hypothetical protein
LLTETKFKELYEQALRARAAGASAAARERLFYLFDHGRTVGGYGVVRLSFVLRELAGLADLTDASRDEEAALALAGLQQRRDHREALARAAKAGFTELQELVYINQALADPSRSRDLLAELWEARDQRPELVPVCQTLSSLLGQEMLLQSNPAAIALEYEMERLKWSLLDLLRQLEHPTGEQGIGPAMQGVRRRIDRFRTLDTTLVRDEERQRLARLAQASQEVWTLMSRYPAADGSPAGDEARALLEDFARALKGFLDKHGIRWGLLRDGEILDQLFRLSRRIAVMICEHRVDEDFPVAELSLPPEYKGGLDYRIETEGLLVYETLLRIGEDGRAEKVANWLLAFRRDGAMYSSLMEAAHRASRHNVEMSLNHEARLLVI